MQSLFHLPTLFYKMCSPLEPPLSFLKMQSLHKLLTVISEKAESAWTLPVYLKNAEFTRASHLQSLLELPSAVSAWTPVLFLQNAEFKRTSHSVLQKCAVQTNSPLCSPKMRSSNELPTVFSKNAEFKCAVRFNFPLHFYKMCSLPEPPSVFLKNAESAWVPPSVFQKCWAQTKFLLCFTKMRSSFQLPMLFLQKSAWTPPLSF